MTTYTQWLAAHEQIIVRLLNNEISNEEAGRQIRALPYISIFERFDTTMRYGIFEVLHEAIEDFYDNHSNAIWYELVHNARIKATKFHSRSNKEAISRFEDILYNSIFAFVEFNGSEDVHAFYQYTQRIEEKIDMVYIALGSELRFINKMREA